MEATMLLRLTTLNLGIFTRQRSETGLSIMLYTEVSTHILIKNLSMILIPAVIKKALIKQSTDLEVLCGKYRKIIPKQLGY